MALPTPRRSVWRSARRVGLRRARVDAFRVYAMVVVIVGHSEYALGPTGLTGVQVGQLALNIIGRFAVPLFLLLAGEHLSPRLLRDRAPGASWPYVRRLATMFVVASALYWCLDVAKLSRRLGLGSGLAAFAARLAHDPWPLFFHGARPHLWFLVALMFVVVLAGVVLSRARVRTFVVISAALYLLGLVIGPYAPVLGLPPALQWGVFLLQSALFFAVGVFFGLEREHTPRRTLGWLLIVLGLALHTLEVYWLSTAYGTSPFRLAMVAGTVPFAVGVGILALEPDASPLDRWAGRFAGSVPTVYLMHMAFIETLMPPPGRFPDLAVRLLLPLLTLVFSFGAAALFERLMARKRRARRRGATVDARRTTTEAP